MSKSAPASVRVLVTDAGGFIAHYLVGFLKERDYRVRGVDLKDPEYAPTAADEFLRVDLCGSGSVLPSRNDGRLATPDARPCRS
jgi:nucleoside-diphosphate-sugar epimerase